MAILAGVDEEGASTLYGISDLQDDDGNWVHWNGPC
jgi:hypothetical protein